jgi:hypothetical protein
MNEDFIFRLGADVSSFTKSITEVEAELKNARAAVKTALGDDLIQANKYVEDLEQSLKNLKAVGVQIPGSKEAANGLKNIAPAAQKAQNTLTGLSGVVRDLPFGFVAIQNNLPILADQFSALSKESGGIGGALKNLGGALIGPAGIAFAFGAVTSIVTSLIQEYGSLGEALNVILGITKPLTEAQKAYNKASFEAAGNAAAEEAKVSILTKTLLDSKKPQADRLAAYGELKKVAPDVVAGIKDENALTNASNILISANSKLRAESVRLKVQEAGITAALTTNETKIAELRAKLIKADAKYVQSSAALNKAKQQAIITGFGSVTAEEAALDAFNNSANAVNELRAQINVLTNENQTYLNQLDPVVLGLAKINEQTRDQIEGLKESNKETQTAESNAKKRAEALKREAIAIEKRNAAERAARSERVPLQVSFQIAEIGKQDFGALYKKKVIDKFKEVQKSAGGVIIPLNLPEIDTAKILQQLKDIQNATAERRAQILKEANLQAATDLFKNTFFTPVQDLFTDLLNGADGAFKAFAKAVLQAINQIVAKIIATGIISLLANILFPGGTGTLLSKVGKDILGALGFKTERIGNPNFSGVGAGALNMAGAVNVVLRGQDLVGSLNRTNSQISRVG